MAHQAAEVGDNCLGLAHHHDILRGGVHRDQDTPVREVGQILLAAHENGRPEADPRAGRLGVVYQHLCPFGDLGADRLAVRIAPLQAQRPGLEHDEAPLLVQGPFDVLGAAVVFFQF